jgi:hypothetical protein
VPLCEGLFATSRQPFFSHPIQFKYKFNLEACQRNKRPSGNCVRLRFSSPSSDPGHRNSLTDGGPLRLWAENWCCGRPTAWSHGNCGCVDGLCSCNFFSGSTFKYYDKIVHFDNVHQVELLFGSSGRGGLEKSVEPSIILGPGTRDANADGLRWIPSFCSSTGHHGHSG